MTLPELAAGASQCVSAGARAFLATGVGIEAGVWTVEDAELLVGCGLAGRVTRVLIEPAEVSRLDAVPLVSAIHDALDR